MGHTFNRPDEAAMLRILERHPHSPEGAILRLAWLEGLSRSEITELRWDQVDFEGKAIQLPDRAVPLEPSTEACLRERHVRCALRDPHVVISERSKKPMPPESISRLSRLALDSEGQKVNLMDLRHDFVIRQLHADAGKRRGGKSLPITKSRPSRRDDLLLLYGSFTCSECTRRWPWRQPCRHPWP